jgi:hypothetical protein
VFDDDVWRYMPLGPALSFGLTVVFAAVALYVAVGQSRWTRPIAGAALAGCLILIVVYTARGSLSYPDGGFSWRLGASIQGGFTNPNSALGLLNVFGNAAMFLPVGWFVATLGPRRPVLVGACCALALSSAVEYGQVLSGSAGDVDDLVLNTAGGLVGALAAVLLRRFSVRARHR